MVSITPYFSSNDDAGYTTSSSYITYSSYITSSSYNDFVFVPTNNSSILITISLATIIPVLIATLVIIVVLLMGLWLAVKKRKRGMVKHRQHIYLIILNLPTGLFSDSSEDTVIQTNEAYISLPVPISGGMQANIAYESISMALQTNAVYEQVDIMH